MAGAVDDADSVGATPTPPAVPHTLTGIAGEDSIALSWQQDGPADFWTVYIDPLDGSASTAYATTQRRFEVTDLKPGDHEVGVTAWRNGLPCPGPGVFLMISVLGPPTGGPDQPAEPELTTTETSIQASWESREAVGWDARLVEANWTVQQRVEGLPAPWVSFTQLRPDTVYGIQVRARGRDDAMSRWSVAAWQRTQKVACGHQPDSPQVSVKD